jgi:hypothetical protein
MICCIVSVSILQNLQDGSPLCRPIELAIYNLTNNILTILDNKLLVGGIFCDLTKSLDYVKHDILLAKLEYFGINCKAGDLIKSCLNDR